MAGKAQDMCQRYTLMVGGRGGSRVRDMARPLLQSFGAKFSERSFPLYNNLKCLIPIILLRLQCALSKTRGP